MEYLKWWTELSPLSFLEKSRLYSDEYISNLSNSTCSAYEFSTLKNKLLKYIHFSNNIDNYNITFCDSATEFINILFKKHVDDDTLIICSNSEHDSVRKCCKNYKNVLEVNNFNVEYEKILQYKKVFVYYIATQISNGWITPDSLFVELKDFFNKNNIEAVFVLDAVQEMFIYPRDYSQFDYIVGTAHSLVIDYDMGILLSKHDNSIGYLYKDRCIKFMELLDIYTKRLYKLSILKYLLIQHFSYLKENHYFTILYDNNINFFVIEARGCILTQEMYDALEKYYIRIEGIENEVQFIRFRAQHFIKYPDALLEGVKLLDILLKDLSK